jgi:hypothetical protein
MNTQSSENQNLNFDSVNILVFLFKWRKVLVITSFAAAVISAVVSLLMEEKFKSSVVFFAAGKGSLGTQLLEEIKKDDVLEFGEKEEAERLLQILNSDRIKNRIIEKYDLWAHYDIPRDTKGANSKMSRAYDENISAKMTRFGSVRIDVLDKNPTMAMNLANDIAALLDTVTNELKNVRAVEAFKIAETEYFHLLNEIQMMEDSMLALRKMGVYDFFAQMEGLNEQYATAILENKMAQAAKIREEMDFIAQYGTLFVKLRTLINASYDREAVQKRRYELLKIDMTSKLPSTFVVDYASEADKKSHPVRWFIVLVSVFSVFVFTIISVLIYENFKMLRSGNRI